MTSRFCTVVCVLRASSPVPGRHSGEHVDAVPRPHQTGNGGVDSVVGRRQAPCPSRASPMLRSVRSRNKLRSHDANLTGSRRAWSGRPHRPGSSRAGGHEVLRVALDREHVGRQHRVCGDVQLRDDDLRDVARCRRLPPADILRDAIEG